MHDVTQTNTEVQELNNHYNVNVQNQVQEVFILEMSSSKNFSGIDFPLTNARLFYTSINQSC